jgi:hypothetical protein
MKTITTLKKLEKALEYGKTSLVYGSAESIM